MSKHINIYVSFDEHDVIVSAYHEDKEVYNKVTGVSKRELAFAFEEEVIPLRNLLEALGYVTTEEFMHV